MRIIHSGSNSLIADGPIGWGITPFEGNFYIRKKHLATDGFRVNYLPGLCLYKFLYVWLDFVAPDGAGNEKSRVEVLVAESAVAVYLVSRCSRRRTSRNTDRGICGIGSLRLILPSDHNSKPDAILTRK